MSSRNCGSWECHFYLLYMITLVAMLFSNSMFVTVKFGPSNVRRHVNIQSFWNNVASAEKHVMKNESKVETSFSACLLVMDDNHRLSEWLAYHYHVLPLRYLVIAVDPNSRTSPSRILDQWRGYGMTILEWNHSNIFKGRLLEYEKVIRPRPRMSYEHRQRQHMFIRNCLVHMKKANRTWVSMIDVDEYLLFNGPVNSQENNAALNYPSIKDDSSVLNFLETARRIPKANLKSPCVLIPRMLFGAVDSSEHEIQRLIPPGIDPHSFDTLKYRKHVQRNTSHKSILNGWAKCIIDVSRAQWSDFPSVEDAFITNGWRFNIHQPMPKICPKVAVKKDAHTLFRINHYVGSWKSYSFRQDARATEGRDKSKWEAKALVNDETDDNIRPWISGFVEKYGAGQASEMLHMAGVFEED